MNRLEEIIKELENRNKGLCTGISKENSVNSMLNETRERCRLAEESLR